MLSAVDFDRYLASLLGSWEALAAPHEGAVVLRGDGYAASLHPEPLLNNGVLLAAGAVAEALACYRGVPEYAVWSLDGDNAVAAALAGAGLRRDITTRPMVCRLGDVQPPAPSADPTDVAVEIGVDPGDIAELNGVSRALLTDVPGVRAYAVPGLSGLLLTPVGDDVNVSFVTTRPAARRRGLAAAVMRTALADASERGFVTASLQATPMAEPMYARLGFTAVGRWQEWVPARP